MNTLGWILVFVAVGLSLAYLRASLLIATASFAAYFVLVSLFSHAGALSLTVLWLLFLLFAVPLNILPLRRSLITKRLLNWYRRVLPTMSRTEREALEAGTVDWDGELFTGKPNWRKFFAFPKPRLTEEEQAFLDGPVEELCRMTDDWDITHNRTDLPPEMWQFIKNKGFFGMIIPKKYGGLEFSALAHSAVITKLSSRSVSVATTVGVPNSLGPAELLLHYGTEEQKNYYLPRLAKGDEIPCFALTGPEAGSDAGAMPDHGIVCQGNFGGKTVLGIRLNWSKRYITLSPVATVLGLAFKLYDPDHLLGDKEELGITCALIPTNTPGITIGRRHFPLNCAFLNGPNQGKDVFIPIDWIIGGQKMVGQGWRMLVESLSAGRAISLPSTVCGTSKMAAFATGAYARIRRQFGLAIGKFEGVEEALARIGAFTYIVDAVRLMTVAAVDRGEKPSVLSAISKCHTTELSRKIANDAMDIHGGKGICLGPRNYLGRGYEETPIGITVEGANILTRSMIIFGQGAIRCHPYLYKEMQAAKDTDHKRGLKVFDKLLFAHAGYMISNQVRAFVLAITGGRLVKVPTDNFKRYFQQVTRYSAALALSADVAMLLLGGELKRKEKLSARFGDVLSMLYLISSVLKQHANHGSPVEDEPVVRWACDYLLYETQQRFDGILRNFPNKWVGRWLRFSIFPLGKRRHKPSDELGHEVASLLINPTATRQRLAEGSYTAATANNWPGLMNEKLPEMIAAEELIHRLFKAKKEGKIQGITLEDRIKAAVSANILTQQEADQLLVIHEARKEFCAVDDFSYDQLARTHLAKA